MTRHRNNAKTQTASALLCLLFISALTLGGCSDSQDKTTSKKSAEEQASIPTPAEKEDTKKTTPPKTLAEDVVFDSTAEGAIDWTLNRGKGELIPQSTGGVIVRLKSPELLRITSAPGSLRLPPESGLSFTPRNKDTYTLSIRYSVYEAPEALSFTWYEYLPEKKGGRKDMRLRGIPREEGAHEVLAEVPLRASATGFRIAAQLSDKNSIGEVAIEQVTLLKKH